MESNNNTKSSKAQVDSEDEDSKIGFSTALVEHLSEVFFKIGFTVATHPWKTIAISLASVIVCCLGFVRFEIEKNPLKMYISSASKYYKDMEWLMSNYDEGYREQTLLITAENVLEPQVLLEINSIYEIVTNFEVKFGTQNKTSWKDLCFRIPSIVGFVDLNDNDDEDEDDDYEDPFDNSTIYNLSSDEQLTSSTSRPYDASVDMAPELFCTIANHLPRVCYIKSLLELWRFDSNAIRNLTLDRVIRDIEMKDRSPVTGLPLNIESLLGGVIRNENNQIVSASSMLMHFYIAMNYSSAKIEDDVEVDAGTEQWVAPEVLKWERELTRMLEPLAIKKQFQLYFTTASSYGDISYHTIFKDIYKLGIGAAVMLAFMIAVLSKWNWIEFRLTVSCLGLLCVGLSCVISVGITSALGFKIGPAHGPLPFILLGINTDDIFVMIAKLADVKQSNAAESIPNKLGLALKASSVSITMTTMTNVVSFFIGSFTESPSISLFCINAVIGVLAMYVLIVTFFVAVLALDEQRIELRINSIIPCLKHATKPDSIVKTEKQPEFIEFLYSKIILTRAGKLTVIAIWIVVTMYGIHGVVNLKKSFEPTWLLPDDSYLTAFLQKQEDFYPDAGHTGYIYTGQLNYTQAMPNLIELSRQLQTRSDIIHNFDSWTLKFNDFVSLYYNKSLMHTPEHEWKLYLSKFLFTEFGGKYRENLLFEEKLKCGEPVTDIKIASFNFEFVAHHEYIAVKNELTALLDRAELSKSGDGYVMIWAKFFVQWLTEEMVDNEIVRNMSLALVGVMLVTILMIPNLTACALIFVSVALALLNIIGYMEKLGLTINIISAFGLQFAIGLTADYSAHFAHTYMVTTEGNRVERIVASARKIASAIFFAGTTTVIGMVLIGTSSTYGPRAIFQIFALLIVFGVINGLFLLPVMLSFVGPKSYKESKFEKTKL